MGNKKFYWLKLKDDFFRQKAIKKLRKIAGGDTYTIIYLKMLLLAIKTDNKLYFEGVEETFAQELSLELDEEENNIKMTLAFLENQNLIELVDTDEYLLTECRTMVGKESESAERMRRHRLKKKNKESIESHCDKEVILSAIEKKEEIERIDIERIKEKWNSVGIGKIVSIKNKRLELVGEIILEFGIDRVIQGIQKIEKSDFLKGNNNRKWIISFDWFIKNSNFIKVIEGNYDNKEGIKNDEKLDYSRIKFD